MQPPATQKRAVLVVVVVVVVVYMCVREGRGRAAPAHSFDHIISGLALGVQGASGVVQPFLVCNRQLGRAANSLHCCGTRLEIDSGKASATSEKTEHGEAPMKQCGEAPRKQCGEAPRKQCGEAPIWCRSEPFKAVQNRSKPFKKGVRQDAELHRMAHNVPLAARVTRGGGVACGVWGMSVRGWLWFREKKAEARREEHSRARGGYDSW
eukprot:352697-Chlamydomonas_euryale.AAC.4